MLFFFPRGVLDEILNLIESVSEGFLPTFAISSCSMLKLLSEYLDVESKSSMISTSFTLLVLSSAM